MAAFNRRARSELEIQRVALRLVDEVMAIGNAGLEAYAIAWLEHGLATILDQHELAFEHIDEFILLLVPMAQRRRRARLQPREIDAELGEPRHIAERRLLAAIGYARVWLRIDSLGADDGFGDVD